MNLYLTTSGRYVGTQADARATGEAWEPVEVPVDKQGLIEYLNETNTRVIEEERYDRGLTTPEPELPKKEAPVISYTEQSVSLDDQVAKAPLSVRLTWASIALEDARKLA